MANSKTYIFFGEPCRHRIRGSPEYFRERRHLTVSRKNPHRARKSSAAGKDTIQENFNMHRNVHA